MKQFRRDIIMQGNGIQVFEIPTGLNYVAVLNNTDNTIEVYQKMVTASDLQDALIQIVPYQNLTVPVRQGGGQQFTVIWMDGGAVSEKRVSLIFADENLNINSQTVTGAGSSNVSIVSESVGLARQNQFPAALSAGGNFKVELQNSAVPVTVSGNVEITNDSGSAVPVSNATQLPASLSPSGGLRVSSNDFKGSHSNAWNGTAVSAGGVSNPSDDLWYSDMVSFYGNTSAATDLTVQFSANNATWYDSEEKRVAVNGNFGFTIDCAARYVRLKSSAAVTITATITAK
jgi:hypothetical protein